MKLEKVSIKKFRSFEKISFDVADVCAIVGKNNAGKSSVLRAINAVFNFKEEEKDFVNGNHSYTKASSPVIELTFVDIPSHKVYSDNGISSTLRLQFKYEYKKKRPSYKFENGNRWHSIPDMLRDKVFEDISFVLIPAARYSELNVDNDSGLLRKVIEKEFELRTKRRDGLSPKVSKLAKEIGKGKFDDIAKKLDRYYSLTHSHDLILDYMDTVDYSMMLKSVGIKIKDCSIIFTTSDCGTGVQSMIAVALYRYWASLNHKSIILGIEEPETNLHPQAQKEFIASFKTDNSSDTEAQIILTTHSATIVDELEHKQIVLVKKTEDEKRGFKSTVSQIRRDFLDYYHLKDHAYGKFHKYRNSDFFFSELVVLAEGEVDAEVIKAFIAEKATNINSFEISVIDLRGVENLKYMLYLLKEIGLEHVVVIDKDFFCPYVNGKREDSLDKNGLPKYKTEFNNAHLELIKHIIPKESERKRLLSLINSNHTKTLDMLEPYGIVCMRFNLESDLVNARDIRLALCRQFRLQGPNCTFAALLKDHRAAVKRSEKLVPAIAHARNYPRSLVRLLKIIRRKL